MEQILLGLNAIHSKGQVHRDLKSDNIVFNKEGQIKIIDFGSGGMMTKKRPKLKELIGTPSYVAP